MHGWQLFQKHCIQCHGAERRGAGPRRGQLVIAPADLRDPLMLARRSDDDLARIILLGGRMVGRSKWMPGFAAELGERDVMDVVAFLRGDSIYLQECFPSAEYYVKLPSETPGPPVLAAYAVPRRHFARPKVVDAPEELPLEARLVGYVMFAELELPGAGPTPTAFLADQTGEVSQMRVALPPPHNERARRDLEDTVTRRIPKLPDLVPLLEEGVQRVRAMAQAPRSR